MRIESIAPGLQRIALLGDDLINVYVADDVLIDSGGRLARRKLFTVLASMHLRAHVLTHAHFDHQGSSRAACDRFRIPLWCGAGDREAMETGDLSLVLPRPDGWIARLSRWLAGPACPVERDLHEGAEVGGFTVVETPGHTPGHLAYWREQDRILILGDVLFHRNPVSRRRGLAEPFPFVTHDLAQNRCSARKLAALEPKVICFGHGSPLRDPNVFRRFVATLPREPTETGSPGIRN